MNSVDLQKKGNETFSNKLSKKTISIAIGLSILLLAIIIYSILGIVNMGKAAEHPLMAYIYQDSELLQTIDLSTVTEEYSFIVQTQDGHSNTITVKQGAIAISDADCPDKLCVSLGFARNSYLPLVCLPHKLVIELKDMNNDGPDIITY